MYLGTHSGWGGLSLLVSPRASSLIEVASIDFQVSQDGRERTWLQILGTPVRDRGLCIRLWINPNLVGATPLVVEKAAQLSQFPSDLSMVHSVTMSSPDSMISDGSGFPRFR